MMFIQFDGMDGPFYVRKDRIIAIEAKRMPHMTPSSSPYPNTPPDMTMLEGFWLFCDGNVRMWAKGTPDTLFASMVGSDIETTGLGGGA